MVSVSGRHSREANMRQITIPQGATAIEVVRRAAIAKYPAFVRGLLALSPVERVVGSPATLATDEHWRLYWCPAALLRWNLDEAVAVLVHELAHPLRRHHSRCRSAEADPRQWNVAADAEINDDVPGLPPDTITPASIGQADGLLAEQYYAALRAQAWQPSSGDDGNPQQPSSGDGNPQPGASSGDGNPQPGASGQPSQFPSGAPQSGSQGGGSAATDPSSSTGSGASGQSDPSSSTGGGSGDGTGQAAAAGRPRPGRCCGGGSAVHGQRQPWEDPAPGEAREDGTPAAPGMSQAEAAVVRARVAQDIRDEVQQRGRGSMPGGWTVWAQAEIDQAALGAAIRLWEQALSSEVRSAAARGRGRDDYSYSRIRHAATIARGYLSPGMLRLRPSVAIVVDTSGSMGGEGTKVLTAIEALCRAVGDVRVISVDAGIHSDRRGIRDMRQACTGLAGGGGTDLRPGIAAACSRPRPDVIVVVTDCDTPWPDTRPPVPVVVASVRGGRCPEWARVVEVQ
jgi:predicted metal-dependent peptidase